jgi:hypothetical protein
MSDEQDPRLLRPGDLKEADDAVGRALGILGNFGHIDTAKLSEEERREYVKKVCGILAMTIAAMPCVQHAMGIAHPQMEQQDRFATVLYHVVRCFGFEPEKEDAPNYFRPRNPTVN